MGTYLLLGNSPQGVSLLVAYSAIKRNAMAARLDAYPRYACAVDAQVKQKATADCSVHLSATVGTNT